MASNELNYEFSHPEYVYSQTPNLHGEIYRWIEMRNITHIVMDRITRLGGPKKVFGKVTRYLSEVVMRCLANYCWNHRYNEKIYLKDAFFLTPFDDELKFFYDDVNYSMKKVDDRCTLVLKMDELGVKELFGRAYDLLKEKSPKFDFRFVVKHYPDMVVFDISQCIKNNILYTMKEEGDIFRVLSKNLGVSAKEYDRLKSTWIGGDLRKMDAYILFALIRYQTLNSGAHQFIVNIEHKNKLKKTFGADFECFGSLFNRTYTHFCSLFYDLEKDFGSQGNFMALTIKSGYYLANPPYEEVLMRRMYTKAVEAISSNKPVIYTLLLPQRPDYPLKAKIDDEKLFLHAMERSEKFHVPGKRDLMITIPPYDFYVFTNIKDEETIKKLVYNATWNVCE